MKGEISEEKYHAEQEKGNALVSFIGKGGIELMNLNQKPFTCYGKIAFCLLRMDYKKL